MSLQTWVAAEHVTAPRERSPWPSSSPPAGRLRRRQGSPCRNALDAQRGSLERPPGGWARISAARHEMTPDEIRRQRVSFVYGNLPHDNPMTKHQVANALARAEGEHA